MYGRRRRDDHAGWGGGFRAQDGGGVGTPSGEMQVRTSEDFTPGLWLRDDVLSVGGTRLCLGSLALWGRSWRC